MGGVQFSVNQTAGSVTLDWSRAFRLNGPLLFYTVNRNDINDPENSISLITTPNRTAVLENQPTDTSRFCDCARLDCEIIVILPNMHTS